MRASLERLASELGIADRVHFVGRRPHSEMPLWLNAASALVLSSKSEGMPNAVVEALACGCPVASTAVGACAEMLVDQPFCQTVPVNDETALAKAIAAMLAESAQTQNRPTFTRTWADMAKEVLSLMDSGR
jgi:teichuronic acid biosynthesis glycosyltransferase TuaC